jgi:hypothetical protein
MNYFLPHFVLPFIPFARLSPASCMTFNLKNTSAATLFQCFRQPSSKYYLTVLAVVKYSTIYSICLIYAFVCQAVSYLHVFQKKIVFAFLKSFDLIKRGMQGKE